MLCDLQEEFSDVTFYFVDSFEVTNYVISKRSKFGFTKKGVLKYPGFPKRPKYGHSYEGYLWWDDIHPTTEGHKIIAAAAVSQADPTRIKAATKVTKKDPLLRQTRLF